MKVTLRRLSSENENDADLMDTVKTYGIISHPLYFINSKSFRLILPFSISFLILGTSLATASTRFRTVSQTRL